MINSRFGFSDFSRNAFTLFSGALLSQLLLVIATPILTRKYSPASFGELALFSSWYTILIGLFTLKFELAILLPKSDNESIRLVKLTILISSLFSIGCLFAFIVLTVSRFIIPGYFFLLPALTLIGAVYSSLQQWFARNKRFSISASSNVISSIFNISTCFLLLYVPTIRTGQMVIAYFLGISSAAIYFGIYFIKYYRNFWIENQLKWSELLNSYSNFPYYMVPTSMLGVLSYQIIPIFLKHFFTIETVGFYSIANRFLYLPSILLGSAIGEVFRVELARQKNQNIDLRPIFKNTFNRMLFIGLPIFICLFLLSPFIFQAVLGKSYLISGKYAQFLILAIFGQFLVQPFTAVYIIFQEMKTLFIFQALLTTIPVITIPIGGIFLKSVPLTLFCISVMTLIVSLTMVFKAYHLISVYSISSPSHE